MSLPLNAARRALSRRWQLTALSLLLLGLVESRKAQAVESRPAPLLPWGATPKDVPDGYMIIEGDIQVPIGFGQSDMPWAVNRWPNGVVPYEFDANVTAENRFAMLNAMAEWTAVANVTFRPRGAEVDYVHIQDSDRNDSAVGHQGGVQFINIFNWNYRFIMCHELAHTLGFWHEQSRSDRDTYVQINWEHIQPLQEHNFDRHDESGRYGLYDFDSVMHYGQFDFSRDGQPTITVLPPNEYWQPRIGQRWHLSRMDKLIMGFLYSFPNWVFVEADYIGPEDGTFGAPYSHFADGVNAASSGGTLWIQPGVYAARGTFSRPMTWQAPLGGVTLGN